MSTKHQPLSEAHRKAISEALKSSEKFHNAVKSESFREAARQRMTGKSPTESTRAKLSASNKGLKRSDEYCAKRSKMHTELWADAEASAKLRESLTQAGINKRGMEATAGLSNAKGEQKTFKQSFGCSSRLRVS